VVVAVSVPVEVRDPHEDTGDLGDGCADDGDEGRDRDDAVRKRTHEAPQLVDDTRHHGDEGRRVVGRARRRDDEAERLGRCGADPARDEAHVHDDHR
jgi:hypothetical protein